MNIILFYFSATGNSLQIARNIAKDLENCVLQSMASSNFKRTVGGIGESIGFIFPVYFNGLPRLGQYYNPNVKVEDIINSCGGMG